MEIGELSGLNYRMNFPQQQMGQEVAMPQQGQAPPQYQFPKDPIAHRKQLTSDYYNNANLLRAFIQEHGADAARPDYAQEGGGMAFQTFQALQANVMLAANALANEQKAEEQLRPYLAKNEIMMNQGVDPQSDMWASQNQFTSTQPLPFVDQSNQFSRDDTYTRGDESRYNNTYAARALQQIDQMEASGQLSPQAAQLQRAAVQKNVSKTPYQTMVAGIRNGRGSSNVPEIEVLKKVTNLAQGVWPDGTYSVKTKGGRPVLENKTYAGEYLGDYQGQDAKGNPKVYRKIVKRWVKDPDTGAVTIEFDNPEIPSEVVSDTKGDVIASALITNNPKYGSAQKMYATARELGVLDDTSSAINETLMPENAEDIRMSARQKAQSEGGAVAEKYAVVKKNLESLENPLLGNNWKIYTLPDGRELEIAKHKSLKGDKKYYIKNWDKFFGGKEEDFENLTLDQAIQYLDDLNYFDQFVGQKPTPQPKQTEETPAQKALREYRERNKK